MRDYLNGGGATTVVTVTLVIVVGSEKFCLLLSALENWKTGLISNFNDFSNDFFMMYSFGIHQF
jgi:hypothetical protein